jgi:hypothetical protein
VRIPDDVRAFAETPDRYTRVTPGFLERFDTGRYVVLRGPHWTAVSGVRVDAEDVEATVREVRKLAGGRTMTWWLGPSTRPPDLYERLRTLGFADPADRVTELITMATLEAPEAPDAPGDVHVRRVETWNDFLAVAELRWEAFEVPPERRERERASLADIFRTTLGADAVTTFLASLDGRPAATGACVVSPYGLLLFGGATAPWARGRGLYRALVRTRWDEAVRRGTPALVVQADPSTSWPILDRLGFVEVCRVRRLEDPT